MMIAFALQFVLCHEFCHLYSGHLDIVESIKSNSTHMRTIEMQADDFAACKLTEAICGGDPDYITSFINDCFLGLHGLFHIIRFFKNGTAYDDMWKETHAPAILRTLHSFRIMDGYAKEFGVDFKEAEYIREKFLHNDLMFQFHNKDVEARVSSAKSLSDAMKAFYPDSMLLFDDSINREHEILVDNLNSHINPMLEKYARICLQSEKLAELGLPVDEVQSPFGLKYSAYWNTDVPVNVVRLSSDGRILALLSHLHNEEQEDLSAGVPCLRCGQATMIYKIAPVPNENGFEKIGSVVCPNCSAQFDTRHLKLIINNRLSKAFDNGEIEEQLYTDTNYSIDEVLSWLSYDLVKKFKIHATQKQFICPKCEKTHKVYSCDEHDLYNIFNKMKLIIAERMSKKKIVICVCLNCGLHWDYAASI